MELGNIAHFPHDIDRERAVPLTIRQGKGRKDRRRPRLGLDRPLHDDVPPGLLVGDTLFLTHLGEPFTHDRLTELVRPWAWLLFHQCWSFNSLRFRQ